MVEDSLGLLAVGWIGIDWNSIRSNKMGMVIISVAEPLGEILCSSGAGLFSLSVDVAVISAESPSVRNIVAISAHVVLTHPHLLFFYDSFLEFEPVGSVPFFSTEHKFNKGC